MNSHVSVKGVLTNLDDEERINRLLEQANEETNEEYQQRLLERATGTKDKRLQVQRHEILVLMQTLKTRLAALDEKRDESFIDRINTDLQRIVDDLPGSMPNLETSTVSSTMRRRFF